MDIQFSPAAQQDFEEAANWYHNQARLGEKFVDAVQNSLHSIARNLKLHAIIFLDLRKARVARFPYLIIYRVRESEIQDIAVHHQKRNPAIWKERGLY